MKLRRTSWLVGAGLMVLAWSNVAQPGESPSTSATGAERAKQQVKPAEPCCGVIAIDAKTGIVTARDKATGKTFQFKPATQGLKVGQSIHAP